MMMQVIEAGGVRVVCDDSRKADADNPKGYYELEKVKELDKGVNTSWLKEYKGKAIKIICYFLPYLPRDLNYRIVFMTRDLDELIDSQNKMLRRRGKDQDPESDQLMKENYKKHLHRVGDILQNLVNFEVTYCSYRDVLENPREYAERVNRFLGGGLDVGSMAAAVEYRLYRNRA